VSDSSAKRAYDHWKQADAAARSAEARLAEAWEGYFSRKASAPDQSLITEVSRLRAIANDRLTNAMVTLSSSAARESTHPGDRSPAARDTKPGAL
jgi:hypothetical protein